MVVELPRAHHGHWGAQLSSWDRAELWDAGHQALYAHEAHRIPATVMSGLGKLSP